MPRYELIEGTSKKFWEITLEGTSFTTTYGRIGTSGQMSMKEYDSEDKAKREYEKLIAEKTRKGYALVGGDGALRAAAAPAVAPVVAQPAAQSVAQPAATSAKPASVFDDEGEDEDDEPKPAAAPAAPPPAAPAAAKPGATSGASKSNEAGARYFEFVEGTASKFWEIKLEGTSFTTRYGRIGTDGQISMKEYDSEEKAQREYAKLIIEKTKKGYEEK